MKRVFAKRFVRGVGILAALGMLADSTLAAPVGPALEREALMVKAPEQVALIDMERAGSRIVAVGEHGVIIISDDQGASWRQAPVPVSTELTALSFVDERRGWAVGHSGVVLATEDGGQTWSKQLDGLQAARLMLEAAKRSGNERALKSAEWLVADGADKPFLDVLFQDAQRGMIIGAYGLAFATEDGGKHWFPIANRLDNPGSLHLYALAGRGEEIVIAAEQGLVLRSTDAGRSFSALSVPYEGSFFTVALPPSGDIVVAGLRGNALLSRDGGEHWHALEVPGKVSANFNCASVDAAGTVWLANAAGMVFKLDDNRLELISSRLRPLNDLLILDSGAALGTSLSGVVPVPATTQGVKQ
ncbi:WD40/YVTN/BNR-like repeat-containing protein [Metapseudomonas furukawaii]|uniref:WD40/YVTN/BNR-like repeat-containing protein n=1 Tax=Metapseudomonas furukawaii TaxID=1149133 RepID=UPI0040451D76